MPAPNLVDLKNLVGQMTGVLTWMKAEREQMRSMVDAMRAILAEAEGTEALAELEEVHEEESQQEDNHEENVGHEEEAHGDPIVSGVIDDPDKY